MRAAFPIPFIATLLLVLAGCGASTPPDASSRLADAWASANGDPEVLADVQTLNRLFTRIQGDGTVTGVTVGSADGTITLTFATFVVQADGTAVSTIKRHDAVNTPTESTLDAVVTRLEGGSVGLQIHVTGKPTAGSYLLRRVSDTAVAWSVDDAVPFNNGRTGGLWKVEADLFDVHLDDQGKTFYSFHEELYTIKPDYVDAHYQVVHGDSDQRFLTDDVTGQAVSFKASQLPDLELKGELTEPELKVQDWHQVAP